MQLNDQQLAFVRHVDGPAALLAVPGSGKTTTIVFRTAALIQSGIPASRILTMTFSKSAAEDMTRRYAELFGAVNTQTAFALSDSVPIKLSGKPLAARADSTFSLNSLAKPTVNTAALFHSQIKAAANFCTIHGFALQCIKYYCRIRKRPEPTILTESAAVNGKNVGSQSRLGMLAQIHNELVGEKIGEDALEALSAYISYAKNTLTDAELRSGNTDGGSKNFDLVFNAYEQLKKSRHMIDFDDMLTVCRRILQMDEGIRSDIQGKYDYIQVDEAQDSSFVQNEIIDIIAKPKNNLVMIGDEDQSIYVWRGAYPSGILEFSKRYPGASVFFMETNYRSHPKIVRAADFFIKTNKERTKKTLISAAQLEELDEKGSSHSKPKGSRVIEIAHTKNVTEQHALICKFLGTASGSTAVLYRNNRSIYSLADMLEREKISFYLRDYKDTILSHWVTKDIRAFLCLIMDPSDIHSFATVAFRMKAYITKSVVEQFQSKDGSGSVFRRLRQMKELQHFQKKHIEEVEHRFKKLAGLKPKEAIIGLLECVSYYDTIEYAARTQGYKVEYLNGIIDTLISIAEGQTTISGFLTRLASLRSILNEAKSPTNVHNRLTLSTVHSSKGLEFDRVILIDMIEGEFPSAETEEGGSAEEEERRLCYVGLTRARKELKIIVPKNSGRNKTKPSRFIKELEAAIR